MKLEASVGYLEKVCKIYDFVKLRGNERMVNCDVSEKLGAVSESKLEYIPLPTPYY